jgi:hypothetical protein
MLPPTTPFSIDTENLWPKRGRTPLPDDRRIWGFAKPDRVEFSPVSQSVKDEKN